MSRDKEIQHLESLLTQFDADAVDSEDYQRTFVRLVELRADADKAALFDEMRKALEKVLERWSFDKRQYHTHTWHDMQDCRAVIVPLLERANKIANGDAK